MYSNYLRCCIYFTLITYGVSLFCWTCVEDDDISKDPACLVTELKDCSGNETLHGNESTELVSGSVINLSKKLSSTQEYSSEEDVVEHKNYVCYVVYGDVLMSDINAPPPELDEMYSEISNSSQEINNKSTPSNPNPNTKNCWNLNDFRKLRSGELVLKTHGHDAPIILGPGTRRGCFEKTDNIQNDTAVCNCVRYRYHLQTPKHLDVRTCIICEYDKCIEPPGVIPVNPPREGIYATSFCGVTPTLSFYLFLVNISLLRF